MAITVGSKVLVTKGNRDMHIPKGYRATVTEIVELGAEYSHNVRVHLTFGRPVGYSLKHPTITLYAKHKNRLADEVTRLFSGSGLQNIEVTL